jgi:hypothetical protein
MQGKWLNRMWAVVHWFGKNEALLLARASASHNRSNAE